MNPEIDEPPPLSKAGVAAMAAAVTTVRQMWLALGGEETEEVANFAHTLTLAAIGGFIRNGGLDVEDEDLECIEAMCDDVLSEITALRHTH
ncbi:hypothetical protein [Methylobacterium symbioticum]|uniref:Uncharacterized protein n=1 Tax=Methylobacterium symbioticum TaxID=2584084 RepID=A0A509EJ52_9HYPH|nr:hypothetical protein [Methylobacterium symbioticum]VUD74102.1 hypothetical protein MET9862_04727 [Methylobacterium symbioticum]